MKSVAISIENKVRELDGKFWLGLNLIDRGYEVTIGPSWEIKPSLDEIDPDVYIAKDVGDGNVDFFKSLRDAGIAVCGIAPEVGVNSSVDNFMKNRQNILDYIDIYFAWGETTATSLRSLYNSDENKNKIKTTGNPRFDLVTKRMRSIYHSSAEKLNEQYEEFILINTNFGVGNAADRDSTYANIERAHPNWDPKHKAFVESRVLYSIIELIFYLLQKDIGDNIIIRPHPGENHSTYRDIFQPYDDVYVRHYGDVRSWIAAANGVIHYDCTTGIEAALMRTPILSYQAVELESDPKPLSQIVSHEVASPDEVLDWIRDHRTSANGYAMSSEQTEQVRRFFPNIDELAAPKICGIIDGLEPVSGTWDTYEDTTREKIELSVKSSRFGPEIIRLYDYLQDYLTDGDHTQVRTKQRQKFPGLDEKELIERIQIFSDHIVSNSLIIDPVSKTKNTYTIKSA